VFDQDVIECSMLSFSNFEMKQKVGKVGR